MQIIFSLKIIPVELKKKKTFLSFLPFSFFFTPSLSCFSLEKTSIFTSHQKTTVKHKIDGALSHKTICPNILNPKSWLNHQWERTEIWEHRSTMEIWEYRSTIEIYTQNLISWFFLHNVWIYWLILDLVVLLDLLLLLSGFSFGFMGFFYVSLICVFLFHSVSWSHL